MRYFFLLLILLPLSVVSQKKKSNAHYDLLTYGNSVTFPDSSVWYNTKQKFKTYDIKKKVTVIHFWDPSASDQLQSLSEVKELQDAHQEVFVITALKPGIAETKNAEKVRRLLHDQDIYHPVVVFDDYDSLSPYEFSGFGSYIALLENAQLFLEQGVSNPNRDVHSTIDSLIQKAGKKFINKRITGFESYKDDVRTRNVLDRTGQMTFDSKENRLFVVDEYKNLILVLDTDGRVIETIGNGTVGDRDGKFASAHFNQISSIAFDEDKNILYISDALNNKLKKANFESGQVETILGSGGESLISGKDVDGRSGAIDKPGALSYKDGLLWIAMDGDHQLYEFNTLTGRATWKAGSGNRLAAEGNAKNCSFESMNQVYALDKNQVMVLDESNQTMFVFNDSTQTLTRSVEFESLKQNKWIKAFEVVEDKIFYSDVLNECIWKSENGKITLFAGSGEGESGYKEGKKAKARFWNPSAIVKMNRDLIVADSFNGLLRTVSLKKGKTNTLKIYDYKNLFMYSDPFGQKDIVYHEEVSIKSAEVNNLTIDLELPQGYTWDRSGQNEVRISNMDGKEIINGDPSKGYIELDVTSDEFFPNVVVQMYLTTKDPDGKVQYQSLVLNIPFIFRNTGKASASTEYIPFQ